MKWLKWGFKNSKRFIRNKFQRLTHPQGVTDMDTYDIETTYYQWLRSIYSLYRTNASQYVSFDFPDITHKNQTEHFGYWVDRLISLCDTAEKTQETGTEDEFWAILMEIHELHGALLPSMWW